MNLYQLTCEWAQKSNLPLLAEEEVTSTNDWAKKEAFKIKEPIALYLTEHQSHGRGRYERTWNDPGRGDSFLGTWSFKVNFAPSPVLTARIGLCLTNVFHKIFPSLHWSLKAPNDIFISGKKVAGILTETITQGAHHRLLIGIGINGLSFPEKIKESTSLKDENGSLTEKDWLHFLDYLKDQLIELLPVAHLSELQASEQTQILNWLNQNPNLKHSYSSISKDGSLFHEDRKISWSDL